MTIALYNLLTTIANASGVPVRGDYGLQIRSVLTPLRLGANALRVLHESPHNFCGWLVLTPWQTFDGGLARH
jgi:hypothetical protein